MSNYRSSIDLLKLTGAQLVNMEVNGRKANCVAIPVQWNDIFVTADSDGKPKGAMLSLRHWSTSQKFKDICRENNTDKANYIPPSHQIAVGYSKEFQAAAEAAAEKRLRSDEKYMATSPTDDDIKKKSRYDVSDRSRVGYTTPLEQAPAAAYTGTAAAAGASAYNANEAAPGDDLPF